MPTDDHEYFVKQHLIQFSHFLDAKYHKAGVQSSRPSIIYSTAWIIFVIGNILNFVSFSYATQTVLSSLGSAQFIANIICIYMLYRIKPSKIQLFGTVCIIAGNICIVSVANKATSQFDSSQLIDLFERTPYVAYLITILCLSILLQMLYIYLQAYHQHTCQPVANYLISDSINEAQQQPPPEDPEQQQQSSERDSSLSLIPSSKSNVCRKCMHRVHGTLVDKSSVLIPTTYSLVSVMIGTHSVLLGKSTSFLLTESVDSGSEFTQPITYVFIIAWVICTIFWLYRMNAALRKFDGAFIIPLLQVLWMMFSILSGGILFKEFDGYQWYNYLGFIAGALIICFGVSKLSPKDHHQASKKRVVSRSSSRDKVPSHSKESQPASEAHIDLDKLRENLKHLNDQYDPMSMNSLRNSAPDPEIAEYENRRVPVELPPSSRPLRTIHKFFANSQKLLEKVTGADGQTHLAAFAVSSLLSSSSEFELGSTNSDSIVARNSSHEIPTNKDKLQNNQNREVAQSLPAVMPSNLKDAFEKIRLGNLEEETQESANKAAAE